MTVLKGHTKKAQAMVKNAMNHQGITLEDVYDKHSFAKFEAWDYCLHKCQAENGKDFHISSHNTFGFTVAWAITDQETGEIIAIRIETPQNSYKIENSVF